jgi:ribonuclease Z
MEITFLGTSCMQPTKERNHPGILITYKGEGLLFDCGEGIQRQLRCAGIKPTVVTKIFITHWHGDHVLGLPGLLQTMSAAERPEGNRVDIYGPRGTKKYMDLSLQTFASKDVLPLEVHEVKKGVILKTEEYSIFSEELVHSAPCVGFAFVEHDKRKVNMKEVKKLKVPEGPLLGALQRGETVTYNGKKIHPDDVTTLVKGRKVAYATDTRPCDGILRLGKDADVLILESTYLSDLQDKAKEYLHMTAAEAALLANEAQAKKLVLTHFSPRYKKVQDIEEEARAIFDNSIAAHDFMKIDL